MRIKAKGKPVNRLNGGAAASTLITKLDLGCGSNKKPGFYGVDRIKFDGVDLVFDLAKRNPDYIAEVAKYRAGELAGEPCVTNEYVAWPFAADSIDEFHCSHFIEHLDWPQRIHFFNELWRVLKVGAKGQLILPHWASMRYYGDPTHKEPMSEFAFYYLSKRWRLDEKNAPHTDIKHNPNGYNCNFEVVWGHSLHPLLQSRNQEYVTHALTFWKDAAQDLIANFTKLP